MQIENLKLTVEPAKWAPGMTFLPTCDINFEGDEVGSGRSLDVIILGYYPLLSQGHPLPQGRPTIETTLLGGMNPLKPIHNFFFQFLAGKYSEHGHAVSIDDSVSLVTVDVDGIPATRVKIKGKDYVYIYAFPTAFTYNDLLNADGRLPSWFHALLTVRGAGPNDLEFQFSKKVSLTPNFLLPPDFKLPELRDVKLPK